MSMRRLALVLALGSAACTEHAPSFGRLSLSDGGTTEPLTGDSSGGDLPDIERRGRPTDRRHVQQ